MTKKERLATKLRDVRSIRTGSSSEEMLVAILFFDADGRELGNVAMGIADAMMVAKGLLYQCVAATSCKAAEELQKRVKADARTALSAAKRRQKASRKAAAATR
jgi:hypothetical protein